MSFVTFTAAVVKTDRLGIGYRGERVGVGVGGGTGVPGGQRELRRQLTRVNKRLRARSCGCRGNVTSSTRPLNISGMNE